MQSEKYPSDLAEKFMLRLPNGMRDQVSKAAKANNRSMNAEIVARLQASFNKPSFNLAGEPSSTGGLLGPNGIQAFLEQQKIDFQKSLRDSLESDIERIAKKIINFEEDQRKEMIKAAQESALPFNKTKKPKA
jgi:hypothetical protein